MKKQFLLLVMMLLPMMAMADAFGIDGIYYNLNTKTKNAEVTGNPNRYSGSIVIPDQVEYQGSIYSVTSIGHSAFSGCYNLTSVTIPNSVTSIAGYAFFGCNGLTSITIPNSVTAINYNTFYACESLTSVTIGSSVTRIGEYAFTDCKSLTSITIPISVTKIDQYAFSSCSGLTTITIPNSVTNIGESAFSGCSGLTTITIPNSVTRLSLFVFSGCKGLTSVTIPNSVTTIEDCAFRNCSGLTTVTIGKGVNNISTQAFDNCTELRDVYCYPENVPVTSINAFLNSYIEYATLHVPDESINAYSQVEPWKLFKEIVGLSGTTPETPKCKKPTISYENGQLKFASATEGAEFISEITDSDIKKHYDAAILLTTTYNISVFATKNGYDNSETATATLCWITQAPQTEGITNGVAQIPAKAVLIQSESGMLTIQGVDDGTPVRVYSANGTQAGSAISQSGQAVVATNLQAGSVAIVKIGEKAVKVVIK